MPFKAVVIRRELFGLDRKIRAAGNSLKSATWALDRAREARDAQQKNFENAQEVYNMVKGNYDALVEQKSFEDQKT